MNYPRLPDGVQSVSDENVQAFFTDARFGNLAPAYGKPGEAEQNRRRLFRALGADETTIVATMKAVHGGDILDMSSWTAEEIGGPHECDGLLIMNNEHLPIWFTVTLGDCLGIVFSSLSADVPLLGLVHAGRKGAGFGIHVKAVDTIERQHAVPASDLHVIISPSIYQESYRFERLTLELQTPEWAPYVANNHVDVRGRVVTELIARGIRQENIVFAGGDTGDGSGRYFSHARSRRLGEPEGRQAVIARPC